MITAASNKCIKRLSALNRKAKLRQEEDVFIVEGAKMFLEAPEEEIREVYISQSFLQRSDCLEKLERTGYQTVTDDLFVKISDTDTPQGILCVVRQPHYNRKELSNKVDPLLLILENIQDPGNLGTMIRTGEGAGIDGILMSADTVDIFNPKVVRATMGSVFRVPFFREEDISAVIREMKQEGLHIYAAHLSGGRSYTQEDYRTGSAFLIGNEGNGLKPETAALADTCIKIPMAGKVESLNAAIAASILMYEAGRQRRE